ncbi:phospholipid methyltransferase [Tamilnaduibacter salinus]|uniref:phosphatidyl-N-methylethanolamine N-methyltransferase n=1 Tax=Tamilnaduibacter salinus TaxID=1484056 RepID=A0A2A2I224_9GAMM|nr:methyltransferase [Tamilnaduibacter salinus]PAV25185.1 hypothetical protein CF392_12285 [Tamilnaduibacter salinus]PVY79051.1 phospholipid methyltransferase [Tamilnaduibacter salinus]
MLAAGLMLCAVLLSVERLTYYFVSHHPDTWERVCHRRPLSALGGPVNALNTLFYGFKIIQLGVFWGWCMVFGDTLFPLPTAPLAILLLGGAMITFGLVLNASVFHRLGRVGVFYGAQLGHTIPWVHGFPFSLFKHPQYLGTLVSIWGFFLVMRYPHDDWLYLPLLQTLYYAWGAYHEP